MARPALDDGFGKVTKGTCDFCAQEADAELAVRCWRWLGGDRGTGDPQL
jgi:hypothetical protein